ncbi:hypothetical protein [Pseudomonas sp. DTU12.1]|uniref:hypothetical protein n=1 Tax=Pseudomonas sp. DTU12.1 TaxID=2654238 RepID=UPI00132EE6E0|nr:hypothetical protein [Pseudomonas sp. DTU12.1]QHG25031.1 hypothetical protein GDV60_20125 [Pseudomonas sp. DTU12.1]
MQSSKTDIEIYMLAGEVFSTLTSDIQRTHYNNLKGSITLCWSEEKKFNAWAISETTLGGAPIHKIVITYEMARQIYRDVEAFYEFARDIRFLNLLKKMPNGTMPHPLIPKIFNKDDCINNMFFAAITWVYFHELGHLTQEHGFVREERNTSVAESLIQELESSTEKPLSGQASKISHATELAADCEATVMCLVELARHFTDEKLVGKNDDRQALIGCYYLIICSLACIFYRFNGGRVSLANSTPIGTHPDAIFRLECAATQFYEFFDMTKKVLGVTISRVDIISLTKQAADMGAMFWHFVHTDASTSITDIVIRGLLERREYKEYAKEIITTWDEISPKILKLRHFGASFGILQFGERYRQYVFETSEIMKLVKFQKLQTSRTHSNVLQQSE